MSNTARVRESSEFVSLIDHWQTYFHFTTGHLIVGKYTENQMMTYFKAAQSHLEKETTVTVYAADIDMNQNNIDVEMDCLESLTILNSDIWDDPKSHSQDADVSDIYGQKTSNTMVSDCSNSEPSISSGSAKRKRVLKVAK
jgi:hypothetical protein